MTILIGQYEFDGPFTEVADLQEKQGVYAVLHFEDDLYELIHISQADNIRNSIEISPSAYTQNVGEVLIAVLYTSDYGTRERHAIVEDIQLEFDNNENLEFDAQDGLEREIHQLTKSAS